MVTGVAVLQKIVEVYVLVVNPAMKPILIKMNVVYVLVMELKKDSTAMVFLLNLFIINLAFRLFTIYMKPVI